VIDLTFLGTSSGTPTRDRNVTSAVLRAGDGGPTVMVDCGEGTQHQLLASDLTPAGIDALLVTHMHGDHCYGLPGLLASMAINHRRDPLLIVGPRGVRAFVEHALRSSHAGVPFELRWQELEGEGDLPLPGGWTVRARRIVHRVPTWGYVLVEPQRPGHLDVERARAAGVPSGPDLGRLKRGEDVTLAGGTVVRAADCVGAPPRRRRFCILGDTSDASGIADEARGAEILVHEATFAADLEDHALRWGHATAAMAARFAAAVRARHCVITHFSSRYTAGDGAGTVGDLLAEARAAAPDTRFYAAADFARFTLPRDDDAPLERGSGERPRSRRR